LNLGLLLSVVLVVVVVVVPLRLTPEI